MYTCVRWASHCVFSVSYAMSATFLRCHVKLKTVLWKATKVAEVKTSYSFAYLTPDNWPAGISHQTFVKENQVRWKLWIWRGLAHLPLSYGNHTCTQQSMCQNKTCIAFVKMHLIFNVIWLVIILLWCNESNVIIITTYKVTYHVLVTRKPEVIVFIYIWMFF